MSKNPYPVATALLRMANVDPATVRRVEFVSEVNDLETLTVHHVHLNRDTKELDESTATFVSCDVIGKLKALPTEVESEVYNSPDRNAAFNRGYHHAMQMVYAIVHGTDGDA